MPINRRPRILICGAGIAGPALAYWLLRFDFECVLIERAPALRTGGYMIDVWGTGYDLIERYGLLEAIKPRAYLFDQLKFVDDHGRIVAGFGGALFQRALGGRFFSVLRGDLASTLSEAIAGKIETLYGATVAKLREDGSGVEVELSTGRARRFDLVVGADGLRSRVRALAFGPQEAFERYLGYCAASFTVDDYPHRDEATYLSFARPGRQISRFAIRNRRSVFLLVFAKGGMPGVSAHDLAAQKALLHTKFGGDGWESPEILGQLDGCRDLYFDSVSQIRMPRWSRGRVALVGDAAHSPSLLAGAGAAFAMLGAYVLAGELHKSGGNHLAAFAVYEQYLQAFIRRQQNAAVGLAKSFTPTTEFGLKLRNVVVNLMNIRPLGIWLARRMLGEIFPLPNYRA